MVFCELTEKLISLRSDLSREDPEVKDVLFELHDSLWIVSFMVEREFYTKRELKGLWGEKEKENCDKGKK